MSTNSNEIRHVPRPPPGPPPATSRSPNVRRQQAPLVNNHRGGSGPAPPPPVGVVPAAPGQQAGSLPPPPPLPVAAAAPAVAPATTQPTEATDANWNYSFSTPSDSSSVLRGEELCLHSTDDSHSTKDEEIKRLQAALDDAGRSNTALESRYQRAEADLAKANEEIKRLRAALDDSSRSNTTLESRCQRAEAELAKANSQAAQDLTHANSRAERLQTELDSARARIVRLQTDLGQAESSYLEEMQQKANLVAKHGGELLQANRNNRALSGQVDDLSREVRQLTDKVSVLEQEKESVSQQGSRLTELQGELATKTSQLHQLGLQLAELRGDLETKSSHLDTIQSKLRNVKAPWETFIAPFIGGHFNELSDRLHELFNDDGNSTTGNGTGDDASNGATGNGTGDDASNGAAGNGTGNDDNGNSTTGNGTGDDASNGAAANNAAASDDQTSNNRTDIGEDRQSNIHYGSTNENGRQDKPNARSNNGNGSEDLVGTKRRGEKPNTRSNNGNGSEDLAGTKRRGSSRGKSNARNKKSKPDTKEVQGMSEAYEHFKSTHMEKFKASPKHLNSIRDYVKKKCPKTRELYAILEQTDCGYDKTQSAIVLRDAINIAVAWVVNKETLTTLYGPRILSKEHLLQLGWEYSLDTVVFMDGTHKDILKGDVSVENNPYYEATAIAPGKCQGTEESEN